jgi:hypothetical protein
LRMPAPLLLHRISSYVRSLNAALAAQPPYPLASAVALAATCTAEAVWVEGPRSALYLAHLLCLSTALGALLGVAWQAGFALLYRLRAGLAALSWIAAASFTAYALARSLGVFGRLGSHYGSLATQVLAVCLGAGLGFGLLLFGMQPAPHAPLGRLARLHPALLVPLAVLLIASAVACAYVDHTMYVGLYLIAHVGLRLCGLWLSTFALVMLARFVRLPALGRRSWVTLFLLFGWTALTLDERHSDALQAFVTRPWSAMVLRTARGIVDLDRDGYAKLLGGGDCNDLDWSIHPSAREVPGNGIDDNCLFGDARRVEHRAENVPLPKEPSPLSVVLITIDTLRYDRIGAVDPAFGKKGLDTMPELSRWARGAVRFPNAYSPGGWTSVAIGSLMHGRYARRLAWTRYFETNRYRMLRNTEQTKLGAGEQIVKMFPLAWQDPGKPLSWWLQRRGMKTVAVVDDGFSQMLARSVGASLGFHIYREIDPRPLEPTPGSTPSDDAALGYVGRGDSGTATAAIRALRWAVDKKPFFMWVHFFGPHTPNTEHRDVRFDGKGVMQLYDNELRYVDKQLGRLLDALGQLPTQPAVFVTSDHGEALLPNYRSHGMDLREELIRVPLFARVPGWGKGPYPGLVGLIDLMPTILALTQTPAPSGLDGLDLGKYIPPRRALPERVLLSDTWQFRRDGEQFTDLVAAYNGRRKVVLDRGDHSYLAYDQSQPSAAPRPIEGWAVDELVRTMMGYVEETGGTLIQQN